MNRGGTSVRGLTHPYYTFFFWCMIALALPWQQRAEATSLQGIESINVLVENLPQKAIDTGISKNFLKETVEYLLRQENVPITGPGFPYLYVNIMVVETAAGGYAYKCTLALKERAVLQRTPKEWTIATTWERHSLGVSAKARLPATVRASLVALTQAYLLELKAPNATAAPGAVQ